MLIEFSVGNYRSFKNVVTLSMVATNIKSYDEDLDQRTVFIAPDGKTRLLTSAAIYGANASGKSNLIKAFAFVRTMVLHSLQQLADGDEIDVEPFRLAVSTREKPSIFEVIFVYNTTTYRYGFEATSERIVHEWLYHTPHGKSREACLFERTEHEPVYLARGVFREGRRAYNSTRDNVLFLSVLAQNYNDQTALAVTRWFRETAKLVSGLHDFSRPFSIECLEDGHELREGVLHLMSQLDLAVVDIQVKTEAIDFEEMSAKMKMPEDLKSVLRHSLGSDGLKSVEVHTIHHVYDDEGTPIPTETEVFDLDEHESDGTQKLFALAAPIVAALQRGLVLFADEFDSRLHPLVARELIQLFNNSRTNPNHAQLIFTTHDTNLLDNELLRRDQIWFTEKLNNEATELVSLATYKVRNDEAYARRYLQGRYGGIPYIGNLMPIFEGADSYKGAHSVEPEVTLAEAQQ
ncbi:MAG: ATP-binding protein [Chloroflexaceae bacterium]|nr:ATP-binding protein [Chloroflexaceae bacterium]